MFYIIFLVYLFICYLYCRGVSCFSFARCITVDASAYGFYSLSRDKPLTKHTFDSFGTLQRHAAVDIFATNFITPTGNANTDRLVGLHHICYLLHLCSLAWLNPDAVEREVDNRELCRILYDSGSSNIFYLLLRLLSHYFLLNRRCVCCDNFLDFLFRTLCRNNRRNNCRYNCGNTLSISLLATKSKREFNSCIYNKVVECSSGIPSIGLPVR